MSRASCLQHFDLLQKMARTWARSATYVTSTDGLAECVHDDGGNEVVH